MVGDKATACFPVGRRPLILKYEKSSDFDRIERQW